jgi:DNA primase large subunit
MNTNEGTAPLPLFLNKVVSDKKALEVAAILDACHPTHSERLWLAGFLKFCGYSMAEVLDLIREHAQWGDYNERITAQQVASVFHQREVGTTYHKYRMDSRPRKWDLTPVEVLRIKRQKSIDLSKMLCEESKAIAFPHLERLGDFNSWAQYLEK